MEEFYIGTILPWAPNFAPQNWALCNGQLLPISNYQALFSIIGTAYGGDGRTSFGLPDLRGRMPIGMGQGPGLTPRAIGQQFGHETTQLQQQNLPAHSHTLTASNTPSSSLSQAPAAGWTLGAADASTGGRTPTLTPVMMYGPSSPADPVPSAPTSSVGGNEPVGIMPPALCINYIICLNGIYPQRS